MGGKGVRKLFRVLLRLLFKFRLIFGERLVFSGPTLIIPNHVSFLDPVLLYAYLPQNTCFVVNTAIAAKIRFILRFIDHVIIDPLNPYSLKKIVAAIKEGRPVVLFPEGRITTTGNLMKMYNGVGLIALRTNAFLQPITLRGPELSAFSRITDKVKSQWFPSIIMLVGRQVKLDNYSDMNFRQRKKQLSDGILRLLQENAFEARQLVNSRTNLFDMLLDASNTHGSNKIMAEDISGSTTYSKALVGCYVLGDKFRKLLANEQNVGVLLPNSIGHLVTLFSLFFIGKTPAIFNFSTGAENCLASGETAGIKTVLTSRLFIEKGRFEELAARLSTQFRLIYLEDLRQEISLIDKLCGLIRYLLGTEGSPGGSLILFTSGSESKPKGVVLHHSHIIANLYQIASIIDYTPRDKMLNALPMFHSFGLTAGTLLPVLSGLEVFLYPSPLHYKMIPEVAYDKNATVLLGTPTFLLGYAKYAHPYDFYAVRFILAGGEKLKEEVRQLWNDKFGIRIFEGYGTTETAPVLSLNTPLFYRPGSVGRFLPGIEWRLEAVPGIETGGNLLVKGPNVMAGYILHDKGFVPAPEWYDCGDVVEVDGALMISKKRQRNALAPTEMQRSTFPMQERAKRFFSIRKKKKLLNRPFVSTSAKLAKACYSCRQILSSLRNYLSLAVVRPIMFR